MKKIYLFLLICIGLFVCTDLSAQSTQSGSSSNPAGTVASDVAAVVLAEACDDFGICFDEMYAEYRLGLVGIVKVGEGAYRVSYGGTASVLVLVANF